MGWGEPDEYCNIHKTNIENENMKKKKKNYEN